MKNIRLYDLYDYFGVVLNKNTRIAECKTINEARKAAAKYYMDCDGECNIWICKRNPETKTFLSIDAEEFTSFEIPDSFYEF